MSRSRMIDLVWGGIGALVVVSLLMTGDTTGDALGIRRILTPEVGGRWHISQRFRMSARGLNGIDFVARCGLPLPVEVNPRWSSSMELFDRDGRRSLMAAHIDACRTGRITWRDDAAGAVAGKAIVFARRTVVVGDTSAWLNRARRDVPWPGQRIARGEPVCTVYASASSYASCYAGLVEQASAVCRELEGGRG